MFDVFVPDLEYVQTPKAATKRKAVSYTQFIAANGGEKPDENYYKSSAKLAYYKDRLNQKLKKKNPKAFEDYFKELVALRRQGKLDETEKYIQEAPYQEYLTPEEVRSELGDMYDDYINSIRQVNSFNVRQGRQPLHGPVEGEDDITNLNYGRRFASLTVTPSFSYTNETRGTTYSRNYSYDPETGITYKEQGDQSLNPYRDVSRMADGGGFMKPFFERIQEFGTRFNGFKQGAMTGMVDEFVNPNSFTNTFGTLSDTITGISNHFKQRRDRSAMRDDMLADNLFAVNPGGDRGDYVATGTAYGMFRPDQMGAKSPDGMYRGMFYRDGGQKKRPITPEESLKNSAALYNPLVDRLEKIYGKDFAENKEIHASVRQGLNQVLGYTLEDFESGKRVVPAMTPTMKKLQQKLLTMPDSEVKELMAKDYFDVGMFNFKSRLPKDVSYTDALKYYKEYNSLLDQGYTFKEGGNFADKYQVDSIDSIVDAGLPLDMLAAVSIGPSVDPLSQMPTHQANTPVATKIDNTTFISNKPVSINDSTKTAYKYYTEEKQLPSHIAAGIVGNLFQESGLNPGAVETTNTAHGRGIAQWDVRNRWKGLLNWANQNGRDPYDLKTQLDYVLVEPGESTRALEKLKNTSTPEQAAIVFGRIYERPSERHAHWDTRTSVANKLFSGRFADGGQKEDDPQYNQAKARFFLSQWLAKRQQQLGENMGETDPKKIRREYLDQMDNMYETPVVHSNEAIQEIYQPKVDSLQEIHQGIKTKRDSLNNVIENFEGSGLSDKQLKNAILEYIDLGSDQLTANDKLQGMKTEMQLSQKQDPNTLGYTRGREDTKGSGLPNEKLLWIKTEGRDADQQQGTLVHELAHALDASPQEKKVSEIISKYRTGYDEYLDHPSEIYSRLMQFRHKNKIDPKKKFTEEDIQKLRGKATDFQLFDRYRDDQMLELLNKVASVKSPKQRLPHARYGGGFKEGEEYEMTDQELKAFLAAGGQVEYV